MVKYVPQLGKTVPRLDKYWPAILLIGIIIIFLETSKVSFSEIILTLTIFVLAASRLLPGISNIVSNISTLIYNVNALNIFDNNWKVSNDTSVNYIIKLKKN